MDAKPDPIDAARRAREQRAELARIAAELRARRAALPGSHQAAVEIHREARSTFEKEVRYDPRGWVRPVDKVERLYELGAQLSAASRPVYRQKPCPLPEQAEVFGRRGRQYARWRDETGEWREADVVEDSNRVLQIEETIRVERTAEEEEQIQKDRYEYKGLCLELGMLEVFKHPDQECVAAIARAAADGFVDSPPKDWPWILGWLHQPVEWDPDQYIFKVVERHLDDAPDLVRASELTRLRLAWCIELALDTGRSTLEHIFRLAGDEHHATAGKTEQCGRTFLPAGCSPVRWLLGNRGRWAKDEIEPATRDRFHDAVDAEKVETANDIAEALTAIELDALDSYLLRVAPELLETFPETTQEVSPAAPSGELEPMTENLNAEADFWEGLAKDRRTKEEAKESRRRRREEQAVIRESTRLAVNRAASGDDEPIGDEATCRVTIELSRWATLLQELGRAWTVHPGIEAVRERPLPDKGLGVTAGLRLFELACLGASSDEIATELAQAREVLGDYDGPPTILVDDVDKVSDAFNGVWIVFRQLERYYDGEWSPPTGAGSRRSKTSEPKASPQRAVPEPVGVATPTPVVGKANEAGEVPVGDVIQVHFVVKAGSPAWAVISVLSENAGTVLAVNELAKQVDTVLREWDGRQLADRRVGEVALDDPVRYKGSQPAGALHRRHEYGNLSGKEVIERLQSVLRKAGGGEAAKRWRARWIHWDRKLEQVTLEYRE